jgi:hypothetical protein
MLTIGLRGSGHFQGLLLLQEGKTGSVSWAFDTNHV